MVELDIWTCGGNHVRRSSPGPISRLLPAGRYGRGASGGGGGICDPRLMWDGRADDGHPLPARNLAKLKAPGAGLQRIVFRGK